MLEQTVNKLREQLGRCFLNTWDLMTGLLSWKQHLVIGCLGMDRWSQGMKMQFTCNICAQTLLSVWEHLLKEMLTKVQECGFNEV